MKRKTFWFIKIFIALSCAIIFHSEHAFGVNRGLINCGNSCYMNATTQCISYITPLSEYLKKNEISFLNDEENNGIREYINLLKDLQVPTEEQAYTDGPLDINTENNNFHDIMINRINTSFNQYGDPWELDDQQDAPEYLDFFLNYLIDKNQPIQESNFVKELFFIQYSSMTTCATNAAHIFKRIDGPHYKLNVPIPEMQNPSIESCIEKYFELETISSDNQYQCDKCNQKVNAQRQTSLINPPIYLIIAPTRHKNTLQETEVETEVFDENDNPVFDENGNQIVITEKNFEYVQEKILTPITFKEHLRLPAKLFSDQSIGNATYSLISFVVHQGP